MAASTSIMQRIVAGIALGIAFIVMASVFVPTDTRATNADTGPPAHAPAVDRIAGSLGVIEDDTYIVAIDATPEGPRYSVYRATDGQPLDELLTAREVVELYPDLPLLDMSGDADTTLMMVDPGHGYPDE